MLSRPGGLILLLFVPSLSGCVRSNPGLAIIEPALARGTWVGTLVPVELYGEGQRKIEAVALRVESGSELHTPKVTVARPSVGQRAILVNRSWNVLDRRRFQDGARVEITGLMKVDWVKGPAGGRWLSRGPIEPAGKEFSVHPERVRPLGAIARE